LPKGQTEPFSFFLWLPFYIEFLLSRIKLKKMCIKNEKKKIEKPLWGWVIAVAVAEW